MKKFLFGCLGLLVVLGIAGAIGGYHFVYKPARGYLAGFAQLREIPRLEENLVNKAAFAAPADGLLAPEGVGRFLAAQDAMHARLGQRMEALRAKYRTFEGLGSGAQPSIPEMVAAVKDLSALILEAKQAQVEALNGQGFSVAEYEWTRARVYEAAGVPIDGTFERLMRDVAAGRVPDLEGSGEAFENLAPPANRSLVAPHGAKLLERAPLAFFGL